ncbi:MAG: hypothetical protein SGBAC_001666 [Bacillariaceae sp.]
MTVSSLWKALDRAGCGKPVGVKELQEHDSFHGRTNPWNVNDKPDSKCPTLAVDLSIWICEALTCSAFERCKTDSSLHLVYTRTVKLLSLGIKLVVVVEGKRRSRHQEGDDSFRKRRSGTPFWNACQRCGQMLKLLGVPVVRAKAEGEALCALLNAKGIVDGVISNDGDCLLYGAKVLYTKFSLDNLEKKMVMRYDCSNIQACVDDDDGNEYDNEREPKEIVTLDQSDLIAFAILTGSDAVGAGLPKVGCRKAIRFIKKCQLDNPLKRKHAAMDELKSWARAALVAKAANPADRCAHDDEPQAKTKQTCCSCCGHPGTKAKHQKHGCALCSTEPGEPCFALSPGAKFRTAMRKKAMTMEVDFDPESVIKVYQSPNDNQIPLPLLGKSSTTLQMANPNFQGFQEFPMVIRGQNLSESREYLKQSLSSRMARNALLNIDLCENAAAPTSKKLPSSKTKPEPRKINKTMVRGGKPSFEVEWVVKATVTDSEGNPMNEFIFATIEEQQMVKTRYPKLLEEFETKEKERAKQGSAEQEKRRAFLDLLCTGCDPKEESKQKAEVRKAAGRCFREDKRASFGVSEPAVTEKDDLHMNPIDMEISFIKCHDLTKKSGGKRKGKRKQSVWGDDADILLRFVGSKPTEMAKEDDCTLVCTDDCSIATVKRTEADVSDSKSPNLLTPGHLHFLGAKRNVKWHTGPKAGCGNELISGNPRQPEVANLAHVPIQSTAFLEQCCTRDKERSRLSCRRDESSFVACKDSNQIVDHKRRELSAQYTPYMYEKQYEASPSWTSHYARDLDLKCLEDLVRSKKKQMKYESWGRNPDLCLERIDGAAQDRGEEDHCRPSPHYDLKSRYEPQDPCNADFLMQSPHAERLPLPHQQEDNAEYEESDFGLYSDFLRYDKCGSESRYEVDYMQSVQYSHCLELHREDHTRQKRRKVDFDSWHRFQHKRHEEMYDMHHARERKISRRSHWKSNSDCTRAPQDPQNDDCLLWSSHREEEKLELDHPEMLAYSEYQSYDKPNTWHREDDNLSHCHSILSCVSYRLFQDSSVEASPDRSGSSRLQPHMGFSGGRGTNKASEWGVVDDAAEKLKTKINQATLDMECSRELEGQLWLG